MAIGALILLASAYFIILEIRKIINFVKFGLSGGFSYLMIFEWLFIILSIILVIVNYNRADDIEFRTISIIVLGFGYF
jgi:hypothetical protein